MHLKTNSRFKFTGKLNCFDSHIRGRLIKLFDSSNLVLHVMISMWLNMNKNLSYICIRVTTYKLCHITVNVKLLRIHTDLMIWYVLL